MKEIISVNNLTKKYDNKNVISNVNFEINKGEIVGLVGDNGAGKTTIMKCLVGLVRPSEGKIKFMGNDICENISDYLSKIGVVIETPTFYPYLTGWENLENDKRAVKSKGNNLEERAIKELEIEKYLDKKVKKYSMGMKQKLGICRAFVGEVELIILDEPTNGLDIEGILMFRNLINEMSRENGITFLISSHNLTEIENICDRVLYVNNGKVGEIDFKNRNRCEKVVCIESEDVEKLLKVLQKNRNVKIMKVDDKQVEVENYYDNNHLMRDILQEGVEIISWNIKESNLLDMYLAVTKEGENFE